MSCDSDMIGSECRHARDRSVSEEIDAVLINVAVPELEDERRQAPSGLVSIATYAAECGFNIAVCDMAILPGNSIKNIPSSPIYGFSTYTMTYHRTLSILSDLKAREPDAFCVAGGPHASALPEQVSNDFDAVVVGEGEVAFVSILQSFRESRIAVVPSIIRTDIIDNLDSLPFPDYYSYTNVKSYTREIEGDPAICIDSSRGCDHRCRFCNSRVIERGRWRGRSAENVVQEISWHHSMGFKSIRFNDDNFLVNTSRVRRICELLAPIDVKFRIFARAESLTPEICDCLIHAGCRHVAIGVESLSSRMLAFMGKGENVSRIISGVKAAADAGLMTRGFFIAGFPGETNETISESLRALKELPLDEACVYPAIPYPGTDLFHDPKRFGIVWIDPNFSNYIQVGRNRSAGYVLQTDSFGPDDVRRWKAAYEDTFNDLGIAWTGERGVVL